MENKEEETKQTPRITHNFASFDQTDSDLALALAMQEQEREFRQMLESSESESDSSESEYGVEDTEDANNNYAYFEALESDEDDQLGFLDEQDSSSANGDYMEEDDVDPDELSYEELLALGEFIGTEKRGLRSDEITLCLKPCRHACLNGENGIDRCVVCQIEYEEGESLVALPCQHPYHLECISKWLQIKKVCPICNDEASSDQPSKT